LLRRTNPLAPAPPPDRFGGPRSPCFLRRKQRSVSPLGPATLRSRHFYLPISAAAVPRRFRAPWTARVSEVPDGSAASVKTFAAGGVPTGKTGLPRNKISRLPPCSGRAHTNEQATPGPPVRTIADCAWPATDANHGTGGRIVEIEQREKKRLRVSARVLGFRGDRWATRWPEVSENRPWWPSEHSAPPPRHRRLAKSAARDAEGRRRPNLVGTTRTAVSNGVDDKNT